MIEDVGDDVYELPDSDFSKSIAIIFDKTDNGKAGVLLSSKFFYLIERLGKCFHSEELLGHLRKVYPNESVSLYRFTFLRRCVDNEISLDSAEESERLVG